MRSNVMVMDHRDITSSTRLLCDSLKVAAAVIFIDLELVPAVAYFLKDKDATYLTLSVCSLAVTLCLFVPLSSFRLYVTGAALLPFLALSANQLQSNILLHLAGIPLISVGLVTGIYGVFTSVSIQLHLEAVLVLLGINGSFTAYLPFIPLAGFWPLCICFAMVCFPLILAFAVSGVFGYSLAAAVFFGFWFSFDIYLTVLLFSSSLQQHYEENFYFLILFLCVSGAFLMLTAIKTLKRLTVIGEDNLDVVINRPPRGLSTAEISSLKIRRVTLSEERLHICCSICQEDMKAGQKSIPLQPCRHKFHSSCLRRWLRRKSTCPNCNCWLIPVGGTLQRLDDLESAVTPEVREVSISETLREPLLADQAEE